MLAATLAETSSAPIKTSGNGLVRSISATVAIHPVATGSLSRSLTLPGTVGGVESPVSISPLTGGTITSLSIVAGQTVTAGQPVAELADTQGLQAKQAAAQAQLAQAQAVLAGAESPQSQPASVAQAQAQVAQAQAALADAQAKQTADQSASTSGTGASGTGTPGATRSAVADVSAASTAGPASSPTTTPAPATTAPNRATPTTISPDQLSEDAAAVSEAQSELAAAQQQLAAAEHPAPASSSVVAADQAAVDAAQSNLEAANQAVAQLTVTAPVSGTVAQVPIPAGGYASPTLPIASMAGEGQTVTAQASPMAVTVLTGHVGAKAAVSLAIPDPPAPSAATLSSIAPTANPSTQQTAVTFAVAASLQPDAPVSVAVQLALPTGPVVPSDAVVTDPGGRSGVFVVTGIVNPGSLGVKLPSRVPAGTELGRTTFTRIAIGVAETGQTQVTSGIRAGQDIVTTGQTNLSTAQSQRVAVLRSASPAKPHHSSTTPPSQRRTGKHGKAGAQAITNAVDVTVVAVHGSALTLSTPLGQRTFSVPAGFPVTDKGKRIKLAQLKAGEVLKVKFARKAGKLTPVSAAVQ